MSRPTHIRYWLAAVGVFTVCSMAAIAVADRMLDSPLDFSSDAWRKGDVRQRARMVFDLRHSEILAGKSRSEVFEMLGPPDYEGPSNVTYDFIHGSLLGDLLNLPFSNWSEWLSIEFDSEGRVSGMEIQD